MSDLPLGITIEIPGPSASYRGGPDDLDRAILVLEVARAPAGALARLFRWGARGPQRVEIGARTIRVWRDARVRDATTTVPRASVRAIAIAHRVRGLLRPIDAGTDGSGLCVVVRHAIGAPTPLLEHLASVEDAIAVARALHAPLAVELDLPG